ncbi:MAG: hypothetical protein EXS13_06945 [Planctomycetes bacterium]|nr:hypothetical protein [Planctomycetota bacterium]
MSRRAAALLALFAFAGAWITGVFCDVAPRARLGSALLAAFVGAIAGLAIGVALERLVLARLAEQWDEIAAAAAVPTEPTKAADGATNAPIAGPAAIKAPVAPAALQEALR